MLGPHFRPAHCLDHHRNCFRRTMGATGSSNQPVIVLGRHQHQLPPAMSSDLDWLTPRLMLNFAEIALKFDCSSLGHEDFTKSRSSV